MNCAQHTEVSQNSWSESGTSREDAHCRHHSRVPGAQEDRREHSRRLDGHRTHGVLILGD